MFKTIFKLNNFIVILASFLTCLDVNRVTINAYRYAFAKTGKECLNPNRHQGYCIPIYDCEPLKYVLRNRIIESYYFLRMSQCYNGIGKSPYVCCSSEICYIDKLKDRSERIVFPDATTETTNNNVVDPITEVSGGGDNIIFATTPTHLVTTVKQNDAFKLAPKFPMPPNCGSITIFNRIFGGKEAELTEFSWMVNLEYRTVTGKLVSVCAGSIINARYVITAGHCIKGLIEKNIGKVVSLRAGDHNTETDLDCNANGNCIEPYERFGIESIIVHKGFGADKDIGVHYHHDIALIRTDRYITFSNSIQPVCLPSVERSLKVLQTGVSLTVAGWGHNGTAKKTAEKRKVALPVVDHQICRKLHAKRFNVADEQLCAGGVFKEDSCSGDSGGPLMRLSSGGNWILEGIVSFGRGCGLQLPAIYTNVRKYLDWIDENVKM